MKELQRDGRTELLEGLRHYADPNDRNRVVYHDQDSSRDERLQKVIDDAAGLLPRCEEDYADSEDYQLLLRAILEQTKKDDDGRHIPKGKGDGMDSSSLQNPSDPDATYRMKAGEAHRGYSANITETVDKNGSLVTDYQYDTNIRSDVDYLREVIETAEREDEPTVLITDGAYASEELSRQAAEKNIGLITTGLRGRKPREILTEFRLSEDGHAVTECPSGHEPKSSSYIRQTDSIRVSFPRRNCEGCPHREECRVKIKARTAVLILSLGALHHTEEAVRRKDDETMKRIGRIRNGIETIPSVLRRKYRVDTMPVRGKLKTKVFFGFKMFALNFSKLWLHERGLMICRPLQAETV